MKGSLVSDVFLTGEELANKVRKLLSGRDVRAAVAFIGIDYASALEEMLGKGGKVVCDVSMGATNARALDAIRKKYPNSIRKVHGMHAKVIVGASESLVSSANLSRNALGLTEQPGRLVEAGLLLNKESEGFRRLEDWFDSLFLSGEPITDHDIEWLCGCNKRTAISVGGDYSFFDGLRHNSGMLSDAVFALTVATAKPAEVRGAIKIVERRQSEFAYSGLSERHYFAYWGKSFSWWPKRFYAIHWGKFGGVYVNEYTKLVHEPVSDFLFTRSERSHKNDPSLARFRADLLKNGYDFKKMTALLTKRENMLDGSQFSELLKEGCNQ